MGAKQSNVSRVCDQPLKRYSPLQISWFEPSSILKVKLYRGLRYGNILKVLVGKYEGQVVNLLENGE